MENFSRRRGFVDIDLPHRLATVLKGVGIHFRFQHPLYVRGPPSVTVCPDFYLPTFNTIIEFLRFTDYDRFPHCSPTGVDRAAYLVDLYRTSGHIYIPVPPSEKSRDLDHAEWTLQKFLSGTIAKPRVLG